MKGKNRLVGMAVLLAALVSILGSPAHSGEADSRTILQDGLDDLAQGPVSGQHGWTGTTSDFFIQDSVAVQGNALEVGTGSSDRAVDRKGTCLSEGTFTAYLRKSNSAVGHLTLQIREGNRTVGTLDWRDTGNIGYNGSHGHTILLAGAASDVWYEVTLEWSADKKWRFVIRRDGEIVAETQGFVPLDTDFANCVDTIRVRAYGDYGYERGYVDFVMSHAEPTPTPTATPALAQETSLASSTLEEQEGWFGDLDEFMFQDTGALEGTKVVKVTGGYGNRHINKPFAPLTQGVARACLKKSDSGTGDLTFQFIEVDTTHITIDFRNDQVLGRMVGGTFSPMVSPAESGVWYCITIQFRSTPAKQQKITVHKVPNLSPLTLEEVFQGDWEWSHSRWNSAIDGTRIRAHWSFGSHEGLVDSVEVEQTFEPTVEPTPPIIKSPAEGQPFTTPADEDWLVQVGASDPNGGQLTFKPVSVPPGITVHPWGTLSRKAHSAEAPAGTYQIVFLAENEVGLQTQREFTLEVLPGATATPTPTSINTELAILNPAAGQLIPASPGEPLQIDIQVQKAGDVSHFCSWDQQPMSLTLTLEDGACEIHGTPENDDIGIHDVGVRVDFRWSLGGAADHYVDFKIEVTDTPPSSTPTTTVTPAPSSEATLEQLQSAIDDIALLVNDIQNAIAERENVGTSACATNYFVQSGDSLSAIAKHYYQDATLWPKIYGANHDLIGNDPNLILIGQELCIPGPANSIESKPAPDPGIVGPELVLDTDIGNLLITSGFDTPEVANPIEPEDPPGAYVLQISCGAGIVVSGQINLYLDTSTGAGLLTTQIGAGLTAELDPCSISQIGALPDNFLQSKIGWWESPQFIVYGESKISLFVYSGTSGTPFGQGSYDPAVGLSNSIGFTSGTFIEVVIASWENLNGMTDAAHAVLNHSCALQASLTELLPCP